MQWWYQYYFATERGRAGYDKYRREFAKLIWRTASPKWDFDDATFDRSAASFDNPDHVAIAIHNYRWRLGLAEGEARVRRAGEAARRRPRHHRAHDHARGRRQRRTTSRSECLRREVLRPVLAPDHRGRHRTQPPAGSPGGIRRRRPRSRRWQDEPLRHTPPRAVARRGPSAGVRQSDRLAQLAAAHRGEPAREGRARRLLDVHVHQLAPHARATSARGPRSTRTAAWSWSASTRRSSRSSTNVDNVRQAANDMNVQYPIALDSDYAVWHAFGNRYWPAVYIADAEGRIRHHQFGEGGYDDCERAIQQLLREAGAEGVARRPGRRHSRRLRGPGRLDEPTVAGDVPRLRSRVRTSRRAAAPRSTNRARTWLPEMLMLNQWALAGDWTIESRASVLNGRRRADRVPLPRPRRPPRPALA